MRQWRRRKKTLGVFSKYAKRCKSVNISENNNTNTNFFYNSYLLYYTIWDGLSQKTISRYCPFKHQKRKDIFIIKHQYIDDNLRVEQQQRKENFSSISLPDYFFNFICIFSSFFNRKASYLGKHF